MHLQWGLWGYSLVTHFVPLLKAWIFMVHHPSTPKKITSYKIIWMLKDINDTDFTVGECRALRILYLLSKNRACWGMNKVPWLEIRNVVNCKWWEMKYSHLNCKMKGKEKHVWWCGVIPAALQHVWWGVMPSLSLSVSLLFHQKESLHFILHILYLQS